IHPDAINGGAFAKGRSQSENIKAVIADVLGHGNERSMLPGQIEAGWAKHSAAAGGLLFTKAELDAFDEIAREAGEQPWDRNSFKNHTV
ncbi:MAG: Ldh family oxidoreductase, partial [Opitutaceae bacterium]